MVGGHKNGNLWEPVRKIVMIRNSRESSSYPLRRNKAKEIFIIVIVADINIGTCARYVWMELGNN